MVNKYVAPDNNVWYALINQATGSFLSGGFNSDGDGIVAMDNSPMPWQIVPMYSDYQLSSVVMMIRPQSTNQGIGTEICMQNNPCVTDPSSYTQCSNPAPALQLCGTYAFSWAFPNISAPPNYVNEISNPHGEYYLTTIDDNAQSLVSMNTTAEIEESQMYSNGIWALSSMSAINDQAWSTFPSPLYPLAGLTMAAGTGTLQNDVPAAATATPTSTGGSGIFGGSGSTATSTDPYSLPSSTGTTSSTGASSLHPSSSLTSRLMHSKIAGATVGSAVFVALLGLVAWLLRRKKMQRRAAAPPELATSAVAPRPFLGASDSEYGNGYPQQHPGGSRFGSPGPDGKVPEVTYSNLPYSEQTSPLYNNPSYGQQQQYSDPTYTNQPTYNDPSSNQNTYSDPSYFDSSNFDPSNNQTSYNQLSYNQPSYNQQPYNNNT